MMIIEVTHALLAPWAGVTDRVLSTRGAPRAAAGGGVERS